MTILAVDPSVNNIGLAFYDSVSGKLRTRTLQPVKPKGDLAKAALGCQIVRAILVEFLQGERIDVLVAEYPNWQNSTKGFIAAQQGYTLDLAYIVGCVHMGVCPQGIVLLPTPLQWKGNMPKSATEAKVNGAFCNLPKISEHEYDAVGLVLWALNDYKKHPSPR